MLDFKRVMWAAAVIFFIVLLAPATGLCEIPKDPYLYRTLIASLDLEYEHDSFNQGTAKSSYSTFIQTYSLLLRGNLLSRRLIIYDLGVSFSDFNISQTTQNVKTTNNFKNLDFSARTTLLPLSAIPLTIYGERMNLYTNSHESTETIYGIDWLANVRTLPTTEIKAQRTDFSSSSSEIVNTDASVSLKKKLGTMLNNLYYLYSSSDDKTHNLLNTRHTVNFDNRTDISRSTNFFLDASRSIEDTTGTPETRLSGVSLGLDSLTSRDVNQTHRYNYYSSSTPGALQKGQTYFGGVNFTPSSTFKTALNIGATDYLNQTPVNKNTEDGLNTVASANYRITDRLVLNANVQNDTSRTKFESSSAPTVDSKGTINRTQDSLTYSLTEHLFTSEEVSYSDFQAKFDGQQLLRYTLVTELTNLGYRSEYNKWLKYHAAFGLGFSEEKLDGTSNKGAIDNIDVGFTAVPDFNKYVGAKANVNYKRMDKLTQGVLLGSKNQTYHLEFYNKYYKNYAVATVSYDRYKVSSIWLNTLSAPLLASSAIPPSAPINLTTPRISATTFFDETFETYRALLTSSYFRGSNISATAEHTNTSNPVTGSSHSDSVFVFASYSRPLWKGTLQGNLSYDIIKVSSSTGAPSSNEEALANITYSRELLRNLGWQAMVQYDDKISTQISAQTYLVQNSLGYNLREWFFQASHTYRLMRSLGGTSTENTLFFRVSRTIERYF